MSAKIDIRPVVTDHVDTLVDQRPGRPPRASRLDVATQYGLPVVVGVVTGILSNGVAHAGEMLSGAAILTAFSFGLAVLAFQTRTTDTSSKGSLRKRLLDEFFANVLYSVVIGLLWTVLVLVTAVVSPSGVLGHLLAGVVWTVASHYVLVLLMCIKRLRAVYVDASR